MALVISSATVWTALIGYEHIRLAVPVHIGDRDRERCIASAAVTHRWLESAVTFAQQHADGTFQSTRRSRTVIHHHQVWLGVSIQISHSDLSRARATAAVENASFEG